MTEKNLKNWEEMMDEVLSFIHHLPTLHKAQAGHYSQTLVLREPIDQTHV